MITSNKILKLSEEYLNTFKILKQPAVVYINPTQDEINKLIAPQSRGGRSWPLGTGEIRFIADGDRKKVYAWDSGLGLHSDLLKNLNISFSSKLIMGTAYSRVGQKPKMNGWESFSIKKFYVPTFSMNWNWLEKYINCKEYLADLADKMKPLLQKVK